MNQKYSQEELDIINFIENKNPESILNVESEIKKITSTVQNKKGKKLISLRINEDDLRALKLKASDIGIPYQTLIGSVIHQYLNKEITL